MSDDAERAAAIAAAADSPELQRTLAALQSQGNIRGCQVNPARDHLQALQNLIGWTIGGYDTRPKPETAAQKHADSMLILLQYQQPEAATVASADGGPPRVCMYDYLCHTLFGIPMKPVGPDTVAPTIVDLDGNVLTATWLEADWNQYEASCRHRPEPVFAPNRYPYQVPEVQHSAHAHELQCRAQHWILWYHHFPWEELNNRPDEEIERDVNREVTAAARHAGYDHVDYIWYRNPAMSVPDMFHVQVFWIIPFEEARKQSDSCI